MPLCAVCARAACVDSHSRPISSYNGRLSLCASVCAGAPSTHTSLTRAVRTVHSHSAQDQECHSSAVRGAHRQSCARACPSSQDTRSIHTAVLQRFDSQHERRDTLRDPRFTSSACPHNHIKFWLFCCFFGTIPRRQTLSDRIIKMPYAVHMYSLIRYSTWATLHNIFYS